MNTHNSLPLCRFITFFVAALLSWQNFSMAADAKLADKITPQEMAEIMDGVVSCWAKTFVSPGEDMNIIVDLRLSINSNKTIKDIMILDKTRYNSDSEFRHAANQAVAAVRHPECNPMNALPSEKYDTWKALNVQFDTSKM